MTQEDKKLLLKDLCGRLPYGVQCLVNFNDGTKHIMTLKTGLPNSFGMWEFYNKKYSVYSDNFKPYLRSMSNMTEEEIHEFQEILGSDIEVGYGFVNILYSSVHTFSFLELQALFDWLNAHHFDYRGLIEKGLAIEAPKDMYN
jgi:hypothetical protein